MNVLEHLKPLGSWVAIGYPLVILAIVVGYFGNEWSNIHELLFALEWSSFEKILYPGSFVIWIFTSIYTLGGKIETKKAEQETSEKKPRGKDLVGFA